MTTGQCKSIPATGIAGAIFDAWTGDADAQPLSAALAISESAGRKQIASLIEPIAAQITAAVAPAALVWFTPSAKAAGFAATVGIMYICNTTGGAFAATLPQGSTVAGQAIAFKNIGSPVLTLTLTPFAGDTVDGGASQTLPAAMDSVILIAHAGGWYGF